MKHITVIRTMDGKEPNFTKQQRFFDPEDEGFVFKIGHFEKKMREEGLSEMEVEVALLDIGGDFAVCKKIKEFIERHDGMCGKECSHYKPRNGKSGCCVHQVNGYQSGEKATIKLNNKKP